MAHADNGVSAQDQKTSWIETFLFKNRAALIAVFLLVTVVLGFQASGLRMEASFEKMIPNYHPYIANYLKHKEELKGMGNLIWISVENTEGTIYDKEYLETLRQVTEELGYVPGVDRTGLLSLWMSGVRWLKITEEGFDGGPVISDQYDGSPRSMEILKDHIAHSGQIGKIVATNSRSSIVLAPLLEINPESGETLDYQEFSTQLEANIREKFENDKVKIHVVGFAKLVGDLIDGAMDVLVFFAVTVVITMVLLYWYTRCIKSTLMPLVCALVAVIWQAGMLYTLGYGLDPYSMLVPFLVFAIGVSHGVQMINGIKHQAMLGYGSYDAARFSFRLLYVPALCALVTDGVGFAILYVIRIGVLQDMAMGSLIRFPVLIICMLVALPLLMSYVGVSRKSLRILENEEGRQSHPVWDLLSFFGTRAGAKAVILVVSVGVVAGLYSRTNLAIGDLDKGAPELRADSRYNLDNSFIVDNYTATSDVLVVMVETAEQANGNYETQVAIDKLQWRLKHLPGVQSTQSIVDKVKLINMAISEGYPKWMALPKNKETQDWTTFKARWESRELANEYGSLSSVFVYLNDHKAETLTRVVDTIEAFAEEHNSDQHQFLLAAGPAGIQAATNIEIAKAQNLMLLLVYGVVTVMVFLAFRSVRATVCIIIPLMITSLLCEALMPLLDIGVKVATLPVITIGVGIGVDYGVYIYSRMKSLLDQGMNLHDAYYNTLKTTGKAVAFTGITLAMGVFTWSFSPIKFQADMGILLTFMFLWNMIGALCLLPAIARFVLPKAVVYGQKTETEVNSETDPKDGELQGACT